MTENNMQNQTPPAPATPTPKVVPSQAPAQASAPTPAPAVQAQQQPTQIKTPPTKTTDQAPDAEALISSTTPPASILNEKESPKVSTLDKIRDFIHNKGLILGVVAVVIAVVVGFSVIFGFNATDQYQGMIQKIKQDTAEIQSN